MYKGSSSASEHEVFSMLAIALRRVDICESRPVVGECRSSEADSDSPNLFYHQENLSCKNE